MFKAQGQGQVCFVDIVLRAEVYEGPSSMVVVVVVVGAGVATLVEANENSFVYSRKAHFCRTKECSS